MFPPKVLLFVMPISIECICQDQPRHRLYLKDGTILEGYIPDDTAMTSSVITLVTEEATLTIPRIQLHREPELLPMVPREGLQRRTPTRLDGAPIPLPQVNTSED